MSAIESDREFLKARKDFSGGDRSNVWDGISTRARLHVTLEKKDYRSIDQFYPFVAAFITWCTEYENTAPITNVLTRRSEVVVDIGGDMGQ